MLGNSIFSNMGLGIDLGDDGVTLNNSLGHSGPNNYQNFPVLTSVTTGPSGTTIVGSLSSSANTTYTIQFFANAVADPSGYGEGKTYLGQTSVTTNGSGNASFSAVVKAAPNGQSIFSATATDSAGNTSEFSKDLQVQAGTTVAKKDTTTQGNWQGVYGTQGYDIVSGAASLPAYATVTPAGASTYTWTTTSSDPRALQTPGSSNRIAACWYAATSFTIDVNLTDGQTHDIALYLLDWDNAGAASRSRSRVPPPARSWIRDRLQFLKRRLSPVERLRKRDHHGHTARRSQRDRQRAVLRSVRAVDSGERELSSVRTLPRKATGRASTALRATTSSAARPAFPPSPPSRPPARQTTPGRPHHPTLAPSRPRQQQPRRRLLVCRHQLHDRRQSHRRSSARHRPLRARLGQ